MRIKNEEKKWMKSCRKPKLKEYSIAKEDIELESFVNGVAMKNDYKRCCNVVGRESWRWWCGEGHLKEGHQQG